MPTLCWPGTTRANAWCRYTLNHCSVRLPVTVSPGPLPVWGVPSPVRFLGIPTQNAGRTVPCTDPADRQRACSHLSSHAAGAQVLVRSCERCCRCRLCARQVLRAQGIDWANHVDLSDTDPSLTTTPVCLAHHPLIAMSLSHTVLSAPSTLFASHRGCGARRHDGLAGIHKHGTTEGPHT